MAENDATKYIPDTLGELNDGRDYSIRAEA